MLAVANLNQYYGGIDITHLLPHERVKAGSSSPSGRSC